MGHLFDYFAEHCSYKTFNMKDFLTLQGCLTKHAAKQEFKKLVLGIEDGKNNSKKWNDAKKFATTIVNDNFKIFDEAPFVDYWVEKEKIASRRNLKAAQKSQAASQVFAYTDLLSELNSSSSENEGSEYSARASTPSASSSPNEDEDNQTTFYYLTHNGDSYEYKLKPDSSRWIVSDHDVSASFIAYRNTAIKKAEDLKNLNESEQLALDGIILIGNDFVNCDIVPYQVAQAILKEVDQIAYCQPMKLEKSHQDLLAKFAEDMCARLINTTKIQADIRKLRQDQDADVVCDVLTSLLNTYSADYSSNDVNEATLVRDTIDNFLKAYFPNTALTKSLGADVMINDSAKRFTNMDPSLSTSGKRADFSVVSTKSKHVLLSLEAKSNKTKGANDLIKLCRELKDTMVAIGGQGRAGAVLCAILMRGNCCEVYALDHQYDGLYRVILLKNIYLPRTCYEMYQILSIVPLFQQLKLIIEETALVLRNPAATGTRIPDSIPSMHTPTIVRVSKRMLDKRSPAIRHARRKLSFK